MANRDFEMDTGSFGLGATSLAGMGAAALVSGAMEGFNRARQARFDDAERDYAIEAVQSWMAECGHLTAQNAALKAEVAKLKGDLLTVGDVLRRTNAALARHQQ